MIERNKSVSNTLTSAQIILAADAHVADGKLLLEEPTLNIGKLLRYITTTTNSYLFTYKLKSSEANYKVRASKKKKT
jgi:hypothetical protein